MALYKRIEWIWPSIMDTVSAKRAAKQGLWASALCAGSTIIFVILNHFGIQMYSFDMGALVDVFLFIVIGWGIYNMNRFASVAGLFLYLLERIYMWSQYGLKNPAIAIIISLMFINSIRGTLAYHKFSKGKQN